MRYGVATRALAAHLSGGHRLRGRDGDGWPAAATGDGATASGRADVPPGSRPPGADPAHEPRSGAPCAAPAATPRPPAPAARGPAVPTPSSSAADRAPAGRPGGRLHHRHGGGHPPGLRRSADRAGLQRHPAGHRWNDAGVCHRAADPGARPPAPSPSPVRRAAAAPASMRRRRSTPAALPRRVPAAAGTATCARRWIRAPTSCWSTRPSPSGWAATYLLKVTSSAAAGAVELPARALPIDRRLQPAGRGAGSRHRSWPIACTGGQTRPALFYSATIPSGQRLTVRARPTRATAPGSRCCSC